MLFEASRTAVVRVECDRILCPIDVGVVFCQPGFSEYNIVLSKVSDVKDLLFGMAVDVDINVSYVSNIAGLCRLSIG